MARPGEGPIDFGEIELSRRNDKTHKFNRIKTIGKSLLFQRAIRGYARRIPNKYGRKNNGVLYAPYSYRNRRVYAYFNVIIQTICHFYAKSR